MGRRGETRSGEIVCAGEEQEARACKLKELARRAPEGGWKSNHGPYSRSWKKPNGSTSYHARHVDHRPETQKGRAPTNHHVHSRLYVRSTQLRQKEPNKPPSSGKTSCQRLWWHAWVWVNCPFSEEREKWVSTSTFQEQGRAGRQCSTNSPCASSPATKGKLHHSGQSPTEYGFNSLCQRDAETQRLPTMELLRRDLAQTVFTLQAPQGVDVANPNGLYLVPARPKTPPKGRTEVEPAAVIEDMSLQAGTSKRKGQEQGQEKQTDTWPRRRDHDRHRANHSDKNSSRFAAFPQETDRVTPPSYPRILLTGRCTIVIRRFPK